MSAMISIGNKTSNIHIEAVRYEQQPSNEHFDSNWVSCEISVSCGAWNGKWFSTALQTTDFKNLLDSISALNSELRGEATFKTIEQQLEFKIIGNGLGSFEVVGFAISSHAPLCKLSFSFEIDQTYLPQIIDQLKKLRTEFPVREPSST